MHTEEPISAPVDKDVIVAFIDILGFSALIGEMTKNPRSPLYSKLVEALHKINDIGRSDDILATAFSDCIVISAEIAKVGHVVDAAALLARTLLSMGFLSRGAITKGWLVHHDTMVMGQGLIDAYTLESKVAVYPRIILSDTLIYNIEVWKLIRHLPTQRRCQQYGRYDEDFDGLTIIDIFSPYYTELEDTSNKPHRHFDLEQENYLESIKPIIEQGLEKTFRSPGHESKWNWMKTRYHIALEKTDFYRRDCERSRHIDWPPNPYVLDLEKKRKEG